MSHRIEANKRFLDNLYRKGPFQGHAFVVDAAGGTPIHDVGDFTMSDKPVKQWLPWIMDNYTRQVKMSESVEDDRVPVVGLNSGTHIYAAAFGSPVHYYADSNPCALPFIKNSAEADQLEEPEVCKSKPLSRIIEMAQLVREELGNDVIIGPPDMQSGFDSACLIWNKEDLFCSMALEEEKEAVKRFVRKCANLFRNFIGEFYKEFPDASLAHCPLSWVPVGMGPWLSNDECGCMNTELFEEFCLPELIELANTFNGIGMHCCADADHQFESFKKIPNFYAFNRTPTKNGKGFAPMLDVLGGPEGPVFVLGADDEMTKNLIETAPEGSRFIFHGGFEKTDEAKAWYERMRTISPKTS